MLEAVSTTITLRSAFHAFLVAKRVEGCRKKTLVWHDYIFGSAAKALGADTPVTTLTTLPGFANTLSHWGRARAFPCLPGRPSPGSKNIHQMVCS